MQVIISKHEDKTTQNWYGTTLDSKMHFKGSFFDVDKKIIKDFFEKSSNGGSYSLNFDSKNLESILRVLELSEDDVSYTQDITPENGNRKTHDVSKQAYLAYDVSTSIDSFTEWLMPYALNR